MLFRFWVFPDCTFLDISNLSGLPHSHTPPHTLFSPPTFSLSERKFLFFVLGPKALRGAYIINTVIPYFRLLL